MNIGIMGLGVVGKAIRAYHLNVRGDEVYCYDPAQPENGTLTDLNANAEVVFICVPTPGGADGKLDCDAVFDAVGSLTGQKTVIIKSTVMPGTTDSVQELNQQHRVFFVPEFLSADTAEADYAYPYRRPIIGTCGSDDEGWQLTDRYFHESIIPQCPPPNHGVSAMPAIQAELLKLATNAWYATKVTFFNTLYDLGMTQEAIFVLALDYRIGMSHNQIQHKGYRGFGGACLPKDTRALTTILKPPGNAILEAVLSYNATLTTKREKVNA